jgi:hypothetical protein
VLSRLAATEAIRSAAAMILTICNELEVD